MGKLDEFDAAQGNSPLLANRLLYEWLSDDTERNELYAEMSRCGRTLLPFTSEDPASRGVCLVADGALIEAALREHSVAPYALVGGGRFMLAIDERAAHGRQRGMAAGALNFAPRALEEQANAAWCDAAVLACKQHQFDVPTLAADAAMRFTRALFGIPDPWHVPLLRAMARTHLELTYAIVGRHFVPELEPREPWPDFLPAPLALIEQLLQERRASRATADGSVLGRLATNSAGFPDEELATIVLGLISGTIGNVQAAVTIALDAFLRGQLADTARRADPKGLREMIADALKAQPPAAFLARRVRVAASGSLGRHGLQVGTDLVLAMGAAQAPPLLFGHDGTAAGYMHHCVGEHLAWPIVLRIVRGVLQLPGLAQVIDATGQPVRPIKRWGVICQHWPLQYAREQRLQQQPLNVIMRIKPPLAQNLRRIAALITTGAPRIERALRESGHVHFAWFALVNQGSELALFTVYDGDFDAYIEHFALKVELFDDLFAFIEDAPPTPVRRFPKEFVEKIREYDRRGAPFEGYFFSACPGVTVADVLHRIGDGVAP